MSNINHSFSSLIPRATKLLQHWQYYFKSVESNKLVFKKIVRLTYENLIFKLRKPPWVTHELKKMRILSPLSVQFWTKWAVEKTSCHIVSLYLLENYSVIKYFHRYFMKNIIKHYLNCKKIAKFNLKSQWII